MVPKIPERPTREEALRAFEAIDRIFLTDAMRYGPQGCAPNPDIIKLFEWVKFQLSIEKDENGNLIVH
jgi:hypothetical protein